MIYNSQHSINMTTTLKKITCKSWRFYVCACFFLILSACSPELEFSGEHQNEEYLHLYFSKSDTRADLSPDGSGSFSKDDKIGLFVDNGKDVQYRILTYNGNEWRPLLRRSEFGKGSLMLSAHYPAMPEGTAPNTNFTISTEQSQSGQTTSDLLFANTILNEGQYDASFSFKHLMHRLKVEVVESTENVSILVRSKTVGNINLLNGTTSATTSDFQWITPAQNKAGNLEAIIFPQEVAPYRTDDGLLKIETATKEIRYVAPEKLDDGSPLSQFESGKETTMRLHFKEASDLEWANRKVWVYGIQVPENDWKSILPTLQTYLCLPWKEEYGWYDINKRNPSNISGGIPDGMMCWAASASNLLHWWFDRNKEYIEKYIAQDKYTGPDYHFNNNNAVTENKQESDIFQTFLDSFLNEAGNIDEGINWFIHGKKTASNGMRDPINNAGYFKDVFPSGVLLAKGISGMGKETFNKVIKEALANQKAIGVNTGYIKSSHAMTIWGAEFDENGDVSYIYLVDNNDRNNYVYWNYGCMRRKVVYVKIEGGNLMTGYKKGYVGEPEDSYNPINRLYTIETGTEYFKKHFNN